MSTDLPIYPWFDQVPENLKTRNQLAESGLRPGGPVRARVVWRRGKRWADLFALEEAKPKTEATPAQLAALVAALQARSTCPACGYVFDFVLPRHFVPERDCVNCFSKRQAADREAASREARKWLSAADTVILDTETTDLDGYLVQIAIIRAIDGTVLLDTLVNPQHPISDGAHQIHGLSESDLVNAPVFADIADHLFSILSGKFVVVYNVNFDRDILTNEYQRLGMTTIKGRFWNRWMVWRCAMRAYAAWVGDWSEYHQNYRWQPLPGGDHSALGDALACRNVLLAMAKSNAGA